VNELEKKKQEREKRVELIFFLFIKYLKVRKKKMSAMHLIIITMFKVCMIKFIIYIYIYMKSVSQPFRDGVYKKKTFYFFAYRYNIITKKMKRRRFMFHFVVAHKFFEFIFK
jgi:hypothetical protein